MQKKLVKNGNRAILYSLKIARNLGMKKVLIQDQGGWITYRQYPKKLKIELAELKTDYGLIDLADLEKKASSETVLLVNSMPGYHALEGMKQIEKVCNKKGCMIINDISGSIGTENENIGDIIVCSFGKDKPVSLGEGGMISADSKLLSGIDIEEVDLDISGRMNSLKQRLDKINNIRNKILNDLNDYEIIHPDKHGINIIVRNQKEKIINYCNSNNLEYTICPRYIRVDCDAVSIELKKLFID